MAPVTVAVARDAQPIPAPCPSKDAWRELLDLTALDIRREASPADSAYLRHPRTLVAWSRALEVHRTDVEGRMAESRLHLDAVAVAEDAGRQLTERYRAAKADHDTRHASRIRFRSALTARVQECNYLLDRAGLSRHVDAPGLLGSITRALDMLDRDDVDGAHAALAVAVRKAQKLGQ